MPQISFSSPPTVRQNKQQHFFPVKFILASLTIASKAGWVGSRFDHQPEKEASYKQSSLFYHAVSDEEN